MHHAPQVLPSDIRPVLGVLKSFLATCPAHATGQQTGAGHQHGSTGHRQPPQAGHRPQAAPQATSRPQAADSRQIGADRHSRPKNPAKSGQNQARSKGKNALLMTLYIFPEKSIIQLFHYCTYTALYNHSTTFSLLYMYSNTKSLHKNGDFSRAYKGRPPLPKKFRPCFFSQPFWLFPV
jgi:hypothetical protein